MLIGSYVSEAHDGDEAVFGLLIGLVGPSAPVCADPLRECVSGFLRGLGRVELFSEPIQWRSPVREPYSRYAPPPPRPVLRLSSSTGNSEGGMPTLNGGACMPRIVRTSCSRA